MSEEAAERQASVAASRFAWLALGAAGHHKAEEFLHEQIRLAREQSDLTHLQAAELHHELRLRHHSLRVRHLSEILKLAFELGLAVLIILVLVWVGSVIWSANGLVVDAFAVPPDLKEKGFSGEIAASQLIDNLTRMAQSQTSRPTNTYSNNWENDVRIEIPETGISIGEFERVLRGWLGRQTHISGSIYHTPDGVAVTARMGDQPAATFIGSERELPRLIRQAAEHIFGADQPYRYAEYLQNNGQYAKAETVLRDILIAGPDSERAWAWSLLGIVTLNSTGDLQKAGAQLRRSLILDPDLAQGLGLLQTVEIYAGHDEAALALYRRQNQAMESGGARGLSPVAERVWQIMTPAFIAELKGDYRESMPLFHKASQDVDMYGTRLTSVAAQSSDAALAHDVAAARAVLLSVDAETDSAFMPALLDFGNFELPHYFIDAASDRWQAAHDDAAATDSYLAKYAGDYAATAPYARHVWVWPWLALADAKLGRFAEAHALIDKTPGDCQLCVRVRGLIDAEQKNWGGAANWFSRAVKLAPSLPFALTDWGRMLLANGDRKGAIAKFAAAHVIAPHFADPLELWGEALMTQNRSDLALAKFSEAAQYAPNWGRLHLKWGEALKWSGKPGEAQEQWQIARSLSLTAAEQQELSGSASHG